jgi:TPR repeat protein
LGRRYENGVGVTKDVPRAAALYAKGCELLDANACLLAQYRGESPRGDALLKKSVTLYDESCRKGDAKGCGGLGGMLFFGIGVAADREKGARLLKQGCESNDWMSCSALASLYDASLVPDKNPAGPIDDEHTAEALRAKSARLRSVACDNGDEDACETTE